MDISWYKTTFNDLQRYKKSPPSWRAQSNTEYNQTQTSVRNTC